MKLENKITLITGASSGIGKACAEVFAEAGSDLILVARRKNKLEEIAKNLSKFNTRIIFYECDVTKKTSVSNLINNLPEDWKNIDILINNAGLAKGTEKFQDGKIDEWEEVIDTNIKGVLYFSRMILPNMIARKTGMIINMASVAGREVYIGGNIYCTTKAAIRQISKALQVDLNGTGVRVTNIDPGMVETEFSVVRFRGDEEKASNVYKGWTPLSGNDVAELALFCATRPSHVSIPDVLIMATDQANTWLINKKL